MKLKLALITSAIIFVSYITFFQQYKWVSTHTTAYNKSTFYDCTLSEYQELLNSIPKTNEGFYYKSQIIQNTVYTPLSLGRFYLDYWFCRWLYFTSIGGLISIAVFIIYSYIVSLNLKTNTKYMAG